MNHSNDILFNAAFSYENVPFSSEEEFPFLKNTASLFSPLALIDLGKPDFLGAVVEATTNTNKL